MYNYQDVYVTPGRAQQQMPTYAGRSPGVVNNVNDVASRLAFIGNVILYLLVALAIVFIVWNVVMYMVRGNDPAKKKEAAIGVSWGILGLAIIVSIWGLVNILVGSFRTGTGNLPNLPNADFVNKKGGQSTIIIDQSHTVDPGNEIGPADNDPAGEGSM